MSDRRRVTRARPKGVIRIQYFTSATVTGTLFVTMSKTGDRSQATFISSASYSLFTCLAERPERSYCRVMSDLDIIEGLAQREAWQ